MKEGVTSEHDSDHPLIAILGCYHGRGYKILQEIAAFLRGLGISAWTSSELNPTSRSASPREKLDASRKTLEQVSGALYVMLSYRTLGVPPETDITGGMATEVGMMHLLGQMGKVKYRATLYDGDKIIKLVSSLIRGEGWGYEAVAEEGNIEHIKALAFHLCQRLLEEIDVP